MGGQGKRYISDSIGVVPSMENMWDRGSFRPKARATSGTVEVSL